MPCSDRAPWSRYSCAPRVRRCNTMPGRRRPCSLLPAGFRPAHRVQMEVTALHPVDEAGTALPEAAATSAFRVQVNPDGTVRYVDDPGVDEVGYLAYELTTHWFTAAPPLSMDPAPPADAADLCTRHLVVQGAVLAALGRGDKPGPACRTVTWEELQTIDALALRLGLGHAPLQRRDFTGLTGVTDLALRVPDLLFRWWPGDLLAELESLTTLDLDVDRVRLNNLSYLLPTLPLLSFFDLTYPDPYRSYWLALSGQRLEALLAHTPRLTSLTVWGQFLTLPSDLLAGIPALRQLTLKGNFPALPVDLLDSLSQLRSLTIEGWEVGTSPYSRYPDPWSFSLDEIPTALLRPVPRLEKLVLRGNFRELPTTFLAATPRLQHLELRGGSLPPASRLPGLLAHTPALRHLTLAGWDLLELPAILLQGVPQLQSLHLQLEERTAKSVAPTGIRVPPRLLAPTPQLRELILFWEVLAEDGLPADLLTHVPHLRSLRMPYLPSADFLRPVPELKALQLDTAYFLSPAVLAHTPRLQVLHLKDLRYSEYAEVDLLQPLSALTTLSLIVHRRPDLLAHTPHLTSLNLELRGDTLLPADLLAHSPHLTSLTLKTDDDTSLPVDLLTDTPHLTSLTLKASGLQTIPENLLAPTPHLNSLAIHYASLTELPPALLEPVPLLQHLELNLRGLRTSPAAWLEPGSFPPRLERFNRGWTIRSADMYPHAHTPYPYQARRQVLGWINSSQFRPTPPSADEVAALQDLLLRYPYLDAREGIVLR